MADLVVCRWCEGQWNANDPAGFARHEATCASSRWRAECEEFGCDDVGGIE